MIEYTMRGTQTGVINGRSGSARPIEIDGALVATLDGVGALVAMAVRAGRAARTDLEVGICGEHGGEPRSIAFCHDIGLD